MIINLTYIFFIFVAIYFAIDAYVYTRKWQVFPMLFIFLLSLGLEIDWMRSGNYGLDLNDFIWTSRDILWTLGMILFFQCMKNHFPYYYVLPEPKKKIRKSIKK